jgi:dTDP-4-amino-4,6-dideoxygalactose transaminase
MYPISKPQIGIRELISIVKPSRNSVRKFENAFARKIGAKHAVAFPYGRSGLFSILNALKISNSDVIVPAYTCIVVPNAVVYSGNKPVFVDVSLNDFNSTQEAIKKKITSKTKAIIVTHMYGYSVDVKKLRKAIPKDILIIEDSCLSILTKSKGKTIGSEGSGSEINFFSFNPSKQMTTIYGGIVTTNNQNYYKQIKRFRNANFKENRKLELKRLLFFLSNYFLYLKPIYSLVQYLYNNVPVLRKQIKWEKWTVNKIDMPADFKSIFTNMQAKIGLVQLSKLEDLNQKRKKLATIYDVHLKGIKAIRRPPLIEGATYSHYTVRYGKRDKLVEGLKKKGVNVGSAFDYSIPNTQAYAQYKVSSCPNSQKIAQTIINLPFYPSLNRNDVIKICKKIKNVVRSIEQR